MTDDINVKVGFQPRPPRKHRFLDVCAIVFAAALIGTVFKSGIVFALVAAACIILYVITESRSDAQEPPTPKS